MCVSVFLQTLFLFTCIQFISVFTASANNLNQNFANPPPSPQKNNGLSLTDVLLLDLVEVPFCVVVVVVVFFVFFFLFSGVLSSRVIELVAG